VRLWGQIVTQVVNRRNPNTIPEVCRLSAGQTIRRKRRNRQWNWNWQCWWNSRRRFCFSIPKVCYGCNTREFRFGLLKSKRFLFLCIKIAIAPTMATEIKLKNNIAIDLLTHHALLWNCFNLLSIIQMYSKRQCHYVCSLYRQYTTVLIFMNVSVIVFRVLSDIFKVAWIKSKNIGTYISAISYP